LLILATRFRKYNIILKLISKKINISTKNRFEKSMLFYASRNRDLNSIHVLIRIKISLDNSSLYKAAWEFYINIIETLIISKKM
jgi:hypothetical protein